MWIVAGFGGLCAFSAIVGVVRSIQLQRYLAQTPSISEEACLVQYRRLTHNQTCLLYIGLALLLAGLITGVLTIIRHGLVGLVIWLLVIGIVLGIGFRLRSLEKRVRSLPCGSKVLEQEYRRTTENWAKN
jgi:TRAP-type uncharacterized transport system fused permease subunit